MVPFLSASPVVRLPSFVEMAFRQQVAFWDHWGPSPYNGLRHFEGFGPLVRRPHIAWTSFVDVVPFVADGTFVVVGHSCPGAFVAFPAAFLATFLVESLALAVVGLHNPFVVAVGLRPFVVVVGHS